MTPKISIASLVLCSILVNSGAAFGSPFPVTSALVTDVSSREDDGQPSADEQTDEQTDEPMDEPMDEPRIEAVASSVPWSSICDQIGRVRTLALSVNGVVRTKTYVVGSPAQGCPGRCGAGCDGPPVYTEECLVHDACVDLFGNLLAVECTQHLFSAVQGYLGQQACPADAMRALLLARPAPTVVVPAPRAAQTLATNKPATRPAPAQLPKSVKSEIDF